jgi:hypothetical protein
VRTARSHILADFADIRTFWQILRTQEHDISR